MPILRFNGATYSVDHAVKGPNYVHGYSADGSCVVSIDGLQTTHAFNSIEYDGEYLTPDGCVNEKCNEVKVVNGKLVRADGRELPPGALCMVQEFNSGTIGLPTYTTPSGLSRMYNIVINDNGYMRPITIDRTIVDNIHNVIGDHVVIFNYNNSAGSVRDLDVLVNVDGSYTFGVSKEATITCVVGYY